MVSYFFKRLPKHIGIIPDGNRRWAEAQGMTKEKGYFFGIDPGIRLYELCLALGIPELTFYGFTVDNTKRPNYQRDAFRKACVEAVKRLSQRDSALLVVGNTSSPQFPPELLPYTQKRTVFGKGSVKVNFLVNYGWKWDLEHLAQGFSALPSADISRVDLIIRWGGRRRLSGFLPIQSIYADFYVIDDYWPDFKDEHLYQALSWYQEQDITLGG
ncbi:undecaprenyl diphosphate synthase family protein [Carboxydothermus hydrogenoformans]|uniref:Putative undecaprenyl diphosphate synthase n=1 Tax=Carboxydothermus hydrogenoformans (strain ATCC BAA-161 / DSM 6008 / Z-2901) TaxID=246194 RepID=Q3AFH5_CARHZ|nr:undecaprenyl diphosphate synthase family protein [Carboxydothermus hydrogenoformans]ABB13831.1 putative undecaprenyl diphosphate synthase [Carboxydothermus hydrogenoformans Z-2901]